MDHSIEEVPYVVGKVVAVKIVVKPSPIDLHTENISIMSNKEVKI